MPDLSIVLYSFTTVSVVLFLSYLLDRLYPALTQKIAPHLHPSPFWARHVRLGVYLLALLWAGGLYLRVAYATPAAYVTLSTLMRQYGLTATFLIFIVLTPGLLRVYFPHFVLNSLLIVARRALGVSLFLFATLHAALAFFRNYAGSLDQILALAPRHQLAILLGAVALFVFSLGAVTAFDGMVKLFGYGRWKNLQRLIYPATIIVLFHAFFIGSDFGDRQSFYPLLFNYLALTFLLLEIGATWKEMSGGGLARIGLVGLGAAGVFVSLIVR